LAHRYSYVGMAPQCLGHSDGEAQTG
jgi:hypothetical protein